MVNKDTQNLKLGFNDGVKTNPDLMPPQSQPTSFHTPFHKWRFTTEHTDLCSGVLIHDLPPARGSEVSRWFISINSRAKGKSSCFFGD